MLPEQLKKFKETLVKEKETLEKELSEIGKPRPEAKGDFNVNFPQFGQSKDENAQEVAEFEKRKALEFNLEKKLAEINQTLEKIDGGGYGICENCSSEIEKPRLKAMPTASLCASCAIKK